MPHAGAKEVSATPKVCAHCTHIRVDDGKSYCGLRERVDHGGGYGYHYAGAQCRHDPILADRFEPVTTGDRIFIELAESNRHVQRLQEQVRVKDGEVRVLQERLTKVEE